MRNCLALLCVSIAAALTACGGSTQWENPDVNRSQWIADEQTCRRQANREAEREFRTDPVYADNPKYDEAKTLDSRMARLDVKKNSDALFENCMRLRGYRLAKKDERR
ncbi:MAG: hypothetical protein EXQ86_03370 [Rhodospirillales bacterium]|nr:hypothetical protein [Rhodospirillales bacterium]